MPVVEPAGRVIALDFVGFGRSDRPDVPYDLAHQTTYLEGFVDAIDLHDITLVIHDLGSGVGFAYAAAHEDNIKGIVFMEAGIPPVFSSDFVPTGGALADFLASVQTILQPGVGEEIILNQNAFVEQVLPAQITRSLTEAEMNAYRVPFPTPESRRPILDNGPRQFPAAYELVSSYTEWLTTTDVPMLHLYTTPGMVNAEVSVQWSRTHIHTLEQQHMGAGGHFFQEDYAVEIGAAIRDWLGRVVSAN